MVRTYGTPTLIRLATYPAVPIVRWMVPLTFLKLLPLVTEGTLLKTGMHMNQLSWRYLVQGEVDGKYQAKCVHKSAYDPI